MSDPNTVEPPNNGCIEDEHFVHCSEVVHSSELEKCMDNIQVGGKQFVHYREVVHSSECSLSEVPLYSEVPLLGYGNTINRVSIVWKCIM